MFKRIVTAVVLIAAIAAVLLWAPVWFFNALVMILVAGALYEFYRLVMPRDHFSLMTGLLFGILFSAVFIFFGAKGWIFPLFMAAFFVLVMLHMAHSTITEGVVSRIGFILFGTIYIAFTLPAIAWQRASPHGKTLVVFTIAIVALGDTFAYAVGKLAGRHKFSPLISPKKTMEGFIASFAGGLIAAITCWQLFWRDLPFLLVVFLGLSVALVGALGDLVESLIKRSCHVKDSGTLLPGHGGILDRIDALLFAAPFVYFIFKLAGRI